MLLTECSGRTGLMKKTRGIRKVFKSKLAWHNYVLWVTVKGEPSPEHGFVMNINILKQIILEKIISKIDHKNINLEVDFMKGKIATTENLAVAIWNELNLD